MPEGAAPISVLMATRGETAHLAAALASLEAQTLRPADLVVVHTGAGKPPPEVLKATGRLPIRLLSAPGRNLATALNIGLREARTPLVARMDDDDECLPNRFAEQLAYLNAHPEVAVLGTSFERIDPFGHPIGHGVQPADAREVRWRLLIQNCVAHGSVTMRREAVLAAGGYDESCERAQDYDLWLRLTTRAPLIANLPEILYRYRSDPSSRSHGEWAASPAQASVAARALGRAWDALPSVTPDIELDALVASVLSGDRAATAGIERLLTERGPTRERIRAYLWSKTVRGSTPTTAIEAGRSALLREAGASLRSQGVTQVWLWGAGAHTSWVIANQQELGLRIAGIVDDHRHGTRLHAMPVQHPSELDESCDVLLSSDVHEDAIWESSANARARGVRVHRLYGGRCGMPEAAGAAA